MIKNPNSRNLRDKCRQQIATKNYLNFKQKKQVKRSGEGQQCREEVVRVIAAAESVAGEVDGGAEERRAAAAAARG